MDSTKARECVRYAGRSGMPASRVHGTSFPHIRHCSHEKEGFPITAKRPPKSAPKPFQLLPEPSSWRCPLSALIPKPCRRRAAAPSKAPRSTPVKHKDMSNAARFHNGYAPCCPCRQPRASPAMHPGPHPTAPSLPPSRPHIEGCLGIRNHAPLAVLDADLGLPRSHQAFLSNNRPSLDPLTPPR